MEDSDSPWLRRERVQGPDLAHIQDLLSQDGPIDNTQLRQSSQNGAQTPASNPSKRKGKERGRRGCINRGHRQGLHLTWRQSGGNADSGQHQKKSKGERSVSAKGAHKSGDNPLSQGYQWKSRWKKHIADVDETNAEDWLYDIREVALKELIHHTGVAGGEFRRLSERVTVDRLLDASFMLSKWCLPRRFFLQHSVNSKTEKSLTLGVDFAMMAVLASALASGRENPRDLHLEVVEGHDSDLAGALTGLILVVRALPHSNVASLTLSLFSQGIGHRVERFKPVKAAISESLQRACSLRNISWHFVDTRPDRPVLDWREELEVARVTEMTVKTILLLPSHRRMREKCRLLADMPQDLMLCIFEKIFG